MPQKKKGGGSHSELGSFDPVYKEGSPKKGSALAPDDKTKKKVAAFFEGEHLDSIVANGGLWELLGAVFALGDHRLQRYRDYAEMCKDTIVLSAVEMMTEDATQADPDKGRTLWPDEKSPYAKDIEEFIDFHEIEDRYPGWMYNLIRNGDFFLRVKAEPGKGITNIYEDADPTNIYRIEIEGQLEGFIEKKGSASWSAYDIGSGMSGSRSAGGAGSKTEMLRPWEMVHFMLNYRPVHEKLKLKQRVSDPKEANLPDGTKEIEITSTYGTSALENARYSYKILKLLEMVILMGRLSRSALIRIFYLNTDGMTPKERRTAIDTLKRKFEKKDAIKLDPDNLFKTEFNPLSFNDTFVVPTSGGRGDIRAENLGGDLNLKDLVDLEYWNNRFFAGLRIPKAFLGFEETLPGSMGSTTLTRLDIRYARGAKKNQKAGLQGISRLLAIHIAFKHQVHPKKEEVMLHTSSISSAEEMERLDALANKVNLASNMLQSLTNLPEINSVPLIRFVFDNILKMPGAMAKDVIREVPPEGAEGGGGGGGGRGRRFASEDPPNMPLMSESAMLETLRAMGPEDLRNFLMTLSMERQGYSLSEKARSSGRDFTAPLPDFDEDE